MTVPDPIPAPEPPPQGIDLENLAKMLYLADMADEVLSMPGSAWEEHSPFFQAQYRLQAERLTSDLAAQGVMLVRREDLETLVNDGRGGAYDVRGERTAWSSAAERGRAALVRVEERGDR